MLKKSSVTVVIAILLVSAFPLAMGLSTLQTATLYVDPPSIVDETLTPGNNIVLSIRVADIADMYAYEFKLFYENAVLNLTKAIRPAGHFLEPVDPANQFVAKFEIKNNFNATHGRAWFGFTLLFPETPRTGSGILVELTFNVLSVDSTPIVLFETKLANIGGDPLAHEKTDGFFSNVAPPPPPPPARITIDPAKIEDPSLTPSSNFAVNVTINATNLFSYSFKLSYSPAIIEATELQEGTFLNGTGTTSILKSEINNTAGFVIFSVGLTTPPGASGVGVLSNIAFHVVANGTTALTLSEIALKDPDGQTLAFTKADGSFSNLSKKSGDINGDGIVDLFDIVEAAIRYGATPDQVDRWNPDADLNSDGVINVFDLVLICLAFT